MKLEEFVSDSLVQFAQGVQDAREKLAGSDCTVAPFIRDYFDIAENNPVFIGQDCNGDLIQSISFDVALTVEKGTETSGKVSVVAGVFGLSSKGKTMKSNDSISRLKFVIPISLKSSFDEG